MEPEKMAITGVVLVVVVLGLTLGISVLAFQVPTGDGSTLTDIVPDKDLLDLGLEVPENWAFDLADGTTQSLSDLSGKVILVDLMATWCSSCATQNAYLETVYETFGSSVVILSLTIDRSETISMMADYQSDKGLPWDHGLDNGASFTNYFKVTSVPTLVLIDGDGYFRYVHIGTWSDIVLTDKIASMM